MKVAWRITKKRGNWRPVLTIECQKEDWECELAIPGGDASVTIPQAPDWHKQASLGPEYRPEEGWAYSLSLPAQDGKALRADVTLPWRPGAHPEYPEVEAALRQYMAEWERRVLKALESSALEMAGELEHSGEFKRAVAPYVAARRMLDH